MEVITTSTRSMTLFGDHNGGYHVYYRHCDGYPTGLGRELIEALSLGLSQEEIIEKCDLTDERKRVRDLEDVFPELQGDLEYIYVVGDIDTDTTSIQIYKTSCPYEPDYAFPIFFRYKRFFNGTEGAVMHDIERTGSMIISAMHAYHKALNNGHKED